MKDIYGMIVTDTLKRADKPVEEELRPTRANLAGLAVRFGMGFKN